MRARPMAKGLFFHRLGLFLKSERVLLTETLIDQRRVEPLTDSKITLTDKVIKDAFVGVLYCVLWFVYNQYFRHN